ncbi:siderophore-interacting protein [Leekyejoonella antrihumi]|uniref:Siderophore-interacting protein n=1 Tax=Leekyejoonella antrihumi TaxID=1660198 RepID=A0A563DY37_9MICO|nr:siderophore-interacting protein [Leekyejoonella antrihumi]TWP34584.1 siderophore-interacting protein [Leekyejoonella antrihumi]
MSTKTSRGRSQAMLTVQRVEWLTDHMVRVVAGGPGFDDFHNNEFTDRYVKIYFARPGLDLRPPFDVKALRKTMDPGGLPVTRTYTVRWVDEASKTLAIDFVVHGDEGLAGPWAASAQPGDTFVVGGPGGKYAPTEDVDWHLFAGDESAIPAIGAALEALPADAVGMAYLEVDSLELAPEVKAPRGVEIRLVCRAGEGQNPERLRDAVAAGPWPDAEMEVFAHGERAAMKALRKLLKGRGVDRHRISLSGYWAEGRTEDRFSPASGRYPQVEKREPIGQIAD